MNKSLAGTLLALLLVVVGGLRLTFALSEPTLTFDGYQHLRYLEHIANTGLPLRLDTLSYGGHEHLYSPLYYYVLAPFALLMNATLVLKILPNILFVISIFLVYLIGEELSKNRSAALLSAVLAAFTPIAFSQYINDGSPFALIVPLLLAIIYALLDAKKRLTLLVLSGVLLSLTSPLIFLLLGGLLLFLLIMSLEGLKVEKGYSETFFFLLFFGLWSTLLFYKKAFLAKGFSALWSFIPTSVLANYYGDFTLVAAIAIIGVLPLIFGGHAAYYSLFVKRSRRALLLLSIILSVLIALLLRIVSIETGMVVLTLLLCALSAQSLGIIFKYFVQTRAPKLRYAITAIVLFFFIFASVFPALSQAAQAVKNTPTPEHLAAVELLPQGLYLTSPEEGFFFQHAGFATLTDRDFILAEDANARYIQSEEIYRARFVLPVLERIREFGITHIVFSESARKKYLRDNLFFLPHDCFEPIYENSSLSVYEVRCGIKVS